jgi:hypothetical protein
MGRQSRCTWVSARFHFSPLTSSQAGPAAAVVGVPTAADAGTASTMTALRTDTPGELTLHRGRPTPSSTPLRIAPPGDPQRPPPLAHGGRDRRRRTIRVAPTARSERDEVSVLRRASVRLGDPHRRRFASTVACARGLVSDCRRVLVAFTRLFARAMRRAASIRV